jgi:uncharacterized protein
MSQLPRTNNAAELRAFDAVCERLSGFEPVLSAEFVDGFLAALAAGPGVPDADVWLPALCDDAFDRAFADPDDRGQALRSLKARLSVLADQLDPEALLRDPDSLRLAPLMDEWTDDVRRQVQAEDGLDDAEALELQTGVVWSLGFMAAVRGLKTLWTPGSTDDELAAFFGELLAQVEALSLPVQSEPWRAHVQRFYPDSEPQEGPERDQLVTEACYAAQELRLWWFDQAPRPETRRVQPAPGRNDPCHCGSGKKYKKCHGAAA